MVSRREIRRKNLLHRAVYVLVRDPRGRVYLHRRTDTKDIHPGMYDVFAGGVCASGESDDEAAIRELGEELGIEGVRPTFVFRHRITGPGQVLAAVYEVTWDGPIRRQESEVAWGAFVPLDHVMAVMSERPFCPDSRAIFERWLEERREGSVHPGPSDPPS